MALCHQNAQEKRHAHSRDDTNKLIIPSIVIIQSATQKSITYVLFKHTTICKKMVIIKLDMNNERLKNYGEAVGNMCSLQFLIYPKDLVRFRF